LDQVSSYSRRRNSTEAWLSAPFNSGTNRGAADADNLPFELPLVPFLDTRRLFDGLAAPSSSGLKT
jgi:hypothetical protein